MNTTNKSKAAFSKKGQRIIKAQIDTIRLDIENITPCPPPSPRQQSNKCLVSGTNVWGEEVKMIISLNSQLLEYKIHSLSRSSSSFDDVFHMLSPYEKEFLRTGTEHLPATMESKDLKDLRIKD